MAKKLKKEELKKTSGGDFKQYWDKIKDIGKGIKNIPGNPHK